MALRFVGKAFLFLLPIIVIVGFPLCAAFRFGEFTPDDAIVSSMSSSSTPFLIGLHLSDPVPYLDMRSTIERGPEVLVLGTSRVESIRSDFFKKGTSVFIATTAIQRIGHFGHFLDGIPPEKTPKAIIMGLDQKFFNPNYENLQADDIDTTLTQPISVTDVLANLPMVYWDYLHGQFSAAQLFVQHPGKIGFTAIVHGTGIRNDGSLDPGAFLSAKIGNDPAGLSAITQGGEAYEYASTLSPGALAELDSFLSKCKARNISVIGFLPPFSPAAYRLLMSMPPSKEGYLGLLMPSVRAIFSRYGDTVHDFTNPSTAAITENEMMDIVHPTERGALLYFAKMAATDPVLRRYADAAALNAQLAATTTETDIFGNGL